MSACEPARDCALCPRLAAYRSANRAAEPAWHNGPVASFGDPDARLLVVGLAPGRMGANRTGRPFTGDYAGELLYGTLKKFGFAAGRYEARPDDGLALRDCLITNAVRCAPPENKPTPAEAATCRSFLEATLSEHPRVKAVLALGRIAHESVVRALRMPLKDLPFAHGTRHLVGRLALYDSYHCSRYNTQTRRLTAEMFEDVVGAIRSELAA